MAGADGGSDGVAGFPSPPGVVRLSLGRDDDLRIERLDGLPGGFGDGLAGTDESGGGADPPSSGFADLRL